MPNNYYTLDLEGFKELAKYVGISSSIHYVLNDNVAVTNRVYSSNKIIERINNTGIKMNVVTIKPVNGRANMRVGAPYIILDVDSGANITLNTPRAENPTELHLFIINKNLTIKFPTCRWQNGIKPEIKEGYIYELIFSYVDPIVGWLACFNEFNLQQDIQQ